MLQGKETISQFLCLVKDLKDCIENGKTGDYKAKKIFEMSDFVEKISKEILESNYKDEMNKQLLSTCGTNLEEIQNISDKLLTGFLLLKISEDSTRNAVSEFILRFGDSRFSTVCKSLVEKRQIFMTLSSLTNSNSLDDIMIAFLLQMWTKHLKYEPDDEKATKLFDSMLSSKNSFDILAKSSEFDSIEDWKPTVNLIYSRVCLKLKSYEPAFWSLLINSKDFFQKIIKSDDNLTKMLFKFVIDSCQNSKFDQEKCQWINPEEYLNISDIVVILYNLLTLECTFNKTKNFIDEQKANSNRQFWIDVENMYMDFRSNSLSPVKRVVLQ